MKKVLIVVLLFAAIPAYAAQPGLVVVPVTDVWSQPSTDPANLTDDKRETQLLFGERVLIQKTKGNWAQIQAVDQPEFRRHQKWEGYPGWVDTHAIKSADSLKDVTAVVISTWSPTMQPETLPDVWLSLGSFIRSVGKTDYLYVVSTPLGDRCVNITTTRSPLPPSSYRIRNDILKMAEQMIGTAYVWGGLTVGPSPGQPLVNPTLKYGVDCSGLVHLSYRVNGVSVPRDSHEQWMKATRIKRNGLMPADLIFSAKADHPEKITHVALYAGGDQIIEAPQTGLMVRKIAFKEKYGKDLSAVETGDHVGERYIYFGRLLKDE